MSGEIDALGDLATAGLVADTLDRPAARGADGRTADTTADTTVDRHGACANCNAHLDGNFCANCGQKAHLHRSLAHVGEEFLHGITHFDGKAWTTLPMLLFRPGRLTREYIMGRRARYVAPVPLFLLVVFLMFFVLSFVGIKPTGGVTDDNGKPLTQAAAVKELPRLDAELGELDAEIAAVTARRETDALPALQTARAALVGVRDRVRARAAGADTPPFNLATEMQKAQREGKLSVNLGSESLNIIGLKALKNPELVLYKIQSKAYKLSFLLVPLSLPWLWLAFAWKRGVRMYDHAIFALYSISFMSLLFVIGSIALALDFVWGPFWFLLLFVAPIAHMFVQLKGTYALGNFSAAWRTLFLSNAALVILGSYAALMIALGVLD